MNNPTATEIDLSLMMNVPAREYQTTRTHLQGGKGATPSVTQKVENAEQCQAACVSHGTNCITWVYAKTGSTCFFYDVMTLNSFDANTQSGIHGNWVNEAVSGCLTYRTPGTSGPSGNISSCPTQADGTKISMATGNFLQELWQNSKQMVTLTVVILIQQDYMVQQPYKPHYLHIPIKLLPSLWPGIILTETL